MTTFQELLDELLICLSFSVPFINISEKYPRFSKNYTFQFTFLTRKKNKKIKKRKKQGTYGHDSCKTTTGMIINHVEKKKQRTRHQQFLYIPKIIFSRTEISGESPI